MHVSNNYWRCLFHSAQDQVDSIISGRILPDSFCLLAHHSGQAGAGGVLLEFDEFYEA